jgi:hypothetical protein
MECKGCLNPVVGNIHKYLEPLSPICVGCAEILHKSFELFLKMEQNSRDISILYFSYWMKHGTGPIKKDTLVPKE